MVVNGRLISGFYPVRRPFWQGGHAFRTLLTQVKLPILIQFVHRIVVEELNFSCNPALISYPFICRSYQPRSAPEMAKKPLFLHASPKIGRICIYMHIYYISIYKYKEDMLVYINDFLFKRIEHSRAYLQKLEFCIFASANPHFGAKTAGP